MASAPKEFRALKQRIAARDKENARLRAAIRILTAEDPAERGYSDYDDDEGMDDDDFDDDMDSAADGDDDLDAGTSDKPDDRPMAIWDEKDGVYRCTTCCGEIEEGSCFLCFKEHDVLDGAKAPDSLPTDNQAFSGDRELVPRGTTPLLAVQILVYPPSYSNRIGEYAQLLQRGATRLMCEEYSLEFTETSGIIAWANEDLFEEFSGSLMQQGDLWKIYLGRCIQLDEEDYDGSAFMEGLLEDALFFCPMESRWVTVEELAGPRWNGVGHNVKMWGTRPLMTAVEGRNPDIEGGVDLAEGLYDSDGGSGDLNSEPRSEDAIEETGPCLIAENAYDLDDGKLGEDGNESERKNGEEDGDGDGIADEMPIDPTIDVGISFASSGVDEDWDVKSPDVSSCDSDLDSDEELSGDEELRLAQARYSWRPYKY